MQAQQPVLIGGMNLDVQAVPAASYATQPGGTVPGQITLTSGGVARNIAQCLGALTKQQQSPMLISIVGMDSAGDLLLSHWQSLHLPCNGILRKAGVATSMTAYIFNQAGEVAASVADVRTVEEHLRSTDLQQFHVHIQQAGILVLDANLSPEAIQAACGVAHAAHVPIWFEPVSVAKAARATAVLSCLTYTSPNAQELIAMAAAINSVHNTQAADKLQLDLAAGSHESAAAQLHLLAPFVLSVLKAGVKHVILTLGSAGAALCTLPSCGTRVTVQHLPAAPAQVVNTNGAGDCLVAGCLACLLQGSSAVSSLAFGMVVAKEALESRSNLPGLMNVDRMDAAATKLLQQCSTYDLRPGHQPLAKL
ncbi:hypothetical protein ABBQ38_006972 [Trebouxia sp. C0009 RCD-2024]